MITTRAPLRISFFGGGTDFPEYLTIESGAVLATAIDKFSHISTRPVPPFPRKDTPADKNRGFVIESKNVIRSPLGAACLRHCRMRETVESWNTFDLQPFSGLGSSSSLTVALLATLYHIKGHNISRLDLAREAIYVERVLLQENVGFQDQTTAAVGGFNMIEFHGHGGINIYPLNLSPGRQAELESHLLLVFTGLTRRSHDIEGQKLRSFSANHSALRSIRRMVDQGAAIISGESTLEEFGRLLNAAWEAKRALAPAVSTPQIDDLYKYGLQSGAWGGKLLGSGGGGYFLFCVPPESQATFKAKLPHGTCMPIKLSATGVEVCETS